MKEYFLGLCLPRVLMASRSSPVTGSTSTVTSASFSNQLGLGGSCPKSLILLVTSTHLSVIAPTLLSKSPMLLMKSPMLLLEPAIGGKGGIGGQEVMSRKGDLAP